MPQPTVNDVHVSAALTNLSIAFLQSADNFIAGSVFPNVPVEHKRDNYFVFDKGDFHRDEAQLRAPGAESSGSGFDLDNTPEYSCQVWAHHQDVPDQVRVNADPAVDPIRAATEMVTQKLLIRKEKDWASKFFTGGVWDNDVDGVAASAGTNEVIQWSDDVASTPIQDIDNAKSTIQENTGRMPNTLVITQRVMDALKRHPEVLDLIKYSGGAGPEKPALANERTLAQIFGVDRVLVMRAVENTAAKGATATNSFIGGKSALLCYAAPSPSIMMPSAGYTFSWRNYLGAGNPNGMAISQFSGEAMQLRRATRIEGEMAFDHKIVASSMGYFWDNIVA